MTAFSVPKGTKCHVRPAGSAAWKKYVTTRDLAFDTHGVEDNGGCWTFALDGWVMKVATCFVRGRVPDGEGAGRRSADRGRGVSRRRAQRTVKAWKDRGSHRGR